MIVLQPLFERRTYNELLFLLSGGIASGVWFALFLGGWLAAGLLAVTPLVIPVLIAFRWSLWACAVGEGELARRLLTADVRVPAVGKGRPGYVGRIGSVLADGAFWRQQAYGLTRMIGGFGAAVGIVSAIGASLWLVSMPVVYRFGHVEAIWNMNTLPRALAAVPVGLAGLLVSAWLVRGLAAVWRRLSQLLLGGAKAPASVDPLVEAGRRALPIHVASFVGINVVMTLIWALTTRAYFWPEWTVLPLGLLLALHALVLSGLRVEKRWRAVAVHANVQSTVFVFLTGIWAVTSRGYFWPVWPLLAFAVVLGAHVLAVLSRAPERAALIERIGVLTATRAGAVDVAEGELRRIERDLHDGAQARLVALGMSLGLAEQRLAEDPEGARQLLEEARADAEEALRELRDLARGIHPPVLSDRGLEAALAALVARLPLQVAVDVDLAERPPAAQETAAYFVAAEALANASKHADATHVAITVRRTGDDLVVKVEDDGHGGADPNGRGLSGLTRRVAALDGHVRVESPAGGPTTVEAVLPCGR